MYKKHSNTTLVKVKLEVNIMEEKTFGKFKYNTC